MAGKGRQGLERVVEQHLAGDGLETDRDEVARGSYRVIGLDPETSERHLVMVIPATTASVTVEDIEWLAGEAENTDADTVAVTTGGSVTDDARRHAEQSDITVRDPDSYRDGTSGDDTEHRQQSPEAGPQRSDASQQRTRSPPAGTESGRPPAGGGGGQPPRGGQTEQPHQQMTGEGDTTQSDASETLSAGFRPVGGFMYGLLGFVLSFVFTTVYFFYRLNEITDGNIDTVLPDEPQAFGWPFYNANMIDVTVSAGGGTAESINYLDQIDQLNAVVFYGIVGLMLLLSGYSVASRVTEQLTDQESAVAGASVVVGYLPLLAAGTFLFTTENFGTTAGPDIGVSLLLWGVVFSVVFGGLGGYLSQGVR